MPLRKTMIRGEYIFSTFDFALLSSMFVRSSLLTASSSHPNVTTSFDCLHVLLRLDHSAKSVSSIAVVTTGMKWSAMRRSSHF